MERMKAKQQREVGKKRGKGRKILNGKQKNFGSTTNLKEGKRETKEEK